MPATPARIAFALQSYRIVTAGPDTGVVARHGSVARDTPEPIETFFDEEADAQVMAQERLALLSADRRRIVSVANGIHALPSQLVISPVVATAQVIDASRQIDQSGAVVEIGIDFDRDATTIVTWG